MRREKQALSATQTKELLDVTKIGRIATINKDGYPYIVPVHFVRCGDKLYVHGSNKGQKVENILRENKVSFEVDTMDGLIFDNPDTACEINTDYQSAIILGLARMVDDMELKREMLIEIMKKYAPNFVDLPMPDKEIASTGVIEITIEELTGKHYA